MSNSTASRIGSEKSPDCLASDNSSSISEEDEFKRELDLIEERRSSSMCNDVNDELDKRKQALNKFIEEMIQIGRLKGETVQDVITQLEEPLLITTKILSSKSVTQVFVEQLFSSKKFILNNQRLLMT